MSRRFTALNRVGQWPAWCSALLIVNSILGCGKSIDQAVERDRLSELVSPVPSTIEIIGKRITEDGVGELWLSISSSRIGPLPPEVVSSPRPVRSNDSIKEAMIPKEVVLSIAEQLEVQLSQVGKPMGQNAWIRELPHGNHLVRVRDLEMESGWLTVTERLPGDTSPSSPVVAPAR